MKQRADSSWFCSIMCAALRLGFIWFNEATSREFLIFLFTVMALRLGGAICLPLWPVLPKPIPMTQRGDRLLSFLIMFAALRLGFIWFNDEAQSRKFLLFYLHGDDSSIRRCDLFESLTRSVLAYSIETTRRHFLSFLTMLAARRLGICHVFQNRERQKKDEIFYLLNVLLLTDCEDETFLG